MHPGWTEEKLILVKELAKENPIDVDVGNPRTRKKMTDNLEHVWQKCLRDLTQKVKIILASSHRAILSHTFEPTHHINQPG